MNRILKTFAAATASLLLLGIPALSQAYFVAAVKADVRLDLEPVSSFGTTQRNGMSLSDAVDSVRREGDVERVISAETRVSGGREMHYIKILTKDGKVRTRRIPGRRVN